MDGASESLYFSCMSLRPQIAPAAPIPVFFLYGEAPQAPDEATVHVETIAARSGLHDWTIRPHRHRDLHQILVLQSGRVDARLDDRQLGARGPCIVVVPPNVVHAFHFDVDTVGLVATFATGLVQNFSRRAGELEGFLNHATVAGLTRRTAAATDLRRLSGMLLLEFERSARGRNLALHGLLAALIANAYRIAGSASGAQSTSKAKDRELVARFREAIERNFLKHTDIDGYCRILGVSEWQLRRACLRFTEQSPVSLVHLRLLVEAERQLRYTAMNVRQIAYYLGFDDPAYFTRFFRQRTGRSPKEFRDRTAG
jgi:AraC family transcriptional regulator, transcriptional activator of pobA